MKSYEHKSAVTLVEMLIVVVIVAVLATMVIGLASRIDNQGKERLVRNTIEILNSALEQFQDYGYRYKDPDYSSFDFPLDCNGFPQLILRTTLRDASGATNVSIFGGVHDPNYSGSEALYFFLSRVPTSRTTLDKIDRSLISNKDYNKQDMDIEVTFADGSIKMYPLLRVIDPWGKTLRYDYYNELPPPLIIPEDIDYMKKTKRTFPVITSAGTDGVFNTIDDITSR